MTLFEKVQEIVASTLNLSPSAITLETSQNNLSSWDSLAQINMLTAFEEEFDVEFEVEEFAKINSIQEILTYLEKNT